MLAHIGDSRAILCRAGQAVQITEDHKPDRIDEKTLAACNRGDGCFFFFFFLGGGVCVVGLFWGFGVCKLPWSSFESLRSAATLRQLLEPEIAPRNRSGALPTGLRGLGFWGFGVWGFGGLGLWGLGFGGASEEADREGRRPGLERARGLADRGPCQPARVHQVLAPGIPRPVHHQAGFRALFVGGRGGGVLMRVPISTPENYVEV